MKFSVDKKNANFGGTVHISAISTFQQVFTLFYQTISPKHRTATYESAIAAKIAPHGPCVYNLIKLKKL